MSRRMLARAVFEAAALTPEEVLAGDSVEFGLTLKIGPEYTRGASRLVFDFSAMLGTSCPNHWVNEASGYVEAYVSNPLVTYQLRFWDLDNCCMVDRTHPPSREAQRMVVLDLSPGVREGDTIELHWGETTGGFGPGAKVTTVVPRAQHYGYIDVRYFSSIFEGMPDFGHDFKGYRRPQPDHSVALRYRVLPRAPAQTRLLRSAYRALFVCLDRFHNISPLERLDDVAEADAPGDRTRAGTIAFSHPSVHVRSRQLPFADSPSMTDVVDGMHVFWGDVHTHSAYSIDCIRRARMDMTPGELMAYARDRSGLDFYAVTDHHQPSCPSMYHLTRSQWEATLDDVSSCHADGEFVVFPGLEFRCSRGDTVVLFNWVPSYADIDRPEWKDVRALWRDFDGTATMTIPHFHSPGQLPAGAWWFPAKPDMEPVMEIFSDHGSYERRSVRESGRAHCKHFRRDRCAAWFIEHGHRTGFVASSDDHKGHVGVNGLTAVFARDLTREAVWEAYAKRRLYATTNARIRLVFQAEGQLMGSVIENVERKHFCIQVASEGRLKKIELLRNGSLYRLFPGVDRVFATDLTVRDPAPSTWYVRVTQQDNQVAWSSPVWYR